MKYELGEEVGRRHFGYTLSAKAKKGELKGDEVAVKVILKAKSVFEVGIRSSWPRHEVIVAEKKDDIYGILSLILYTMILIPMIKYILIVLLADNNNDGGTFALYTLISWYAKVSLIPNEQAEDAMRSNYKLETISPQMKRAQWIKRKPEGSIVAKYILFLLTVLGNSMVIGDGILTPCISVLSAVSGIKQKAPSLSESTIAILVLFSVQYFVTDKVGYSFAPIILLWFLLLGGIGLYDLIHYNAHVLHAFNAKYIFDYFKRNGKRGWVSLGGVVLCITAMFADPGHFNVRAIQISFTTILFPSGTLAYLGQAVYLTKFPEHVVDTFYRSIPGPLFWPTIVVAISSSIIASQAMIDFCWFCNHLSVPKSRLFLKSYYCTHFLQGRMTSLYS